MNRIVVRARVDADGVLRVAVPVGAAEADREIQITIEPLEALKMTPDEWREFVHATAGSTTDPSFVRHLQGEFERR